MPTGKEPCGGALLDRIPLEAVDIHEAVLKAARPTRARSPWEEPSPTTRGQIREALELYFASHLGSPPVTRTQRAPLVRSLAEAVRLYLRDGPNSVAAEKIARELTQLGWTWRNRLHRYLTSAEREGRLKRGSARSFLGWPAEAAAVARLEGLVLTDRVASAVPRPAARDDCLPLVLEFCFAPVTSQARPHPAIARRWPDPYLRHLISDLAPIWEHLTGRSRLARDVDDLCLFGTWLQRLVNSAKITTERELRRRSMLGLLVTRRLEITVTPRSVYETTRRQHTEIK